MSGMSPQNPRFSALAVALVALLFAVGVAELRAGYVEPVVIKPMFAGEGIELLDVDREKLATNIAVFVINGIRPDGNPREMETARQLLGF